MSKEELENLNNEVENTAEEVQETSSGAPKSLVELFEENKKVFAYAGGAVAVLVVAALFIFIKYLPDQNLKAQDEMYFAQDAFAKDSFNLALNGRATGGTPYKGFAQIAKDYSWTKAGNLANYYAGICCLQLKKYQEAADYLNKASIKDPVIGAVRLNALGDAYSELGKMDDAISYYEKAAAFSDNEVYTPYFLLKAGLANEKAGKKEEAKKLYEKVKEKYPNSDEGRDIEKYIIRVSGS